MDESKMILVECARSERADTVTWLMATADEKGISRKAILSRNKGFLVPIELLGDLPYSIKSVDPVAKVVEVTVPVTRTPEVTPAALYDVGPDNVTAVPPVKDDRPVLFPGLVEPDRETVRAWAKTQPQFDVADKGRLAKAVYEAYELAHS